MPRTRFVSACLPLWSVLTDIHRLVFHNYIEIQVDKKLNEKKMQKQNIFLQSKQQDWHWTYFKNIFYK